MTQKSESCRINGKKSGLRNLLCSAHQQIGSKISRHSDADGTAHWEKGVKLLTWLYVSYL